MPELLRYEDFHPFIRCVGKTSRLHQEVFHVAYDYRILIMYSGIGTLETDSAFYNTRQNEIYIILPGMRYRGIAGEGQSIIVINFDMTHNHSEVGDPVVSVAEELFVKENIIEAFDLSLFFGENGCVKRDISHECIEIADKILAVYSGSRTPADCVMLSGLLSQLVYCAINCKNEHKSPIACDIYSYINSNYYRDISLESTAEAFHIHPTYVNRLLSKNYGTSFRRLLLKARFSRALYLIDNTDMPIKEIAHSVGFNDAQYFSYAFFKHFGYYPTVYRK